MGLFSFLKDVAVEANEDAHGARLLAGVQSSLAAMDGLEMQVRFVALAGYLQIRERLKNEMPNLSREGRVKVGRALQDQARSKFDTDMSGGYANWLAGAWLESKERNSLKAQQAFAILEGLADYIQDEVLNEVNARVGYANFDAWYLEFKKAAARQSRQLALDADNRSMIDFMDHEPLVRAYRDGVSPEQLGREFATQFDFSKFGR